ncbi:DUF616 domain-containing protein [Variovorax sp. PAMC 28711]|uniref:DUF616 domain-containing protein n=1 Tax=Variovorax sp. PAMC 28711 TaxID=1795631 RepID=UPI00078DB0B8|nr:DUF616 domain-containing protein [Variovorax sp. PAMC 28711]AMM24235.1 hypothetical protein AX767_07650 [Variovorax sp. PAMC 28711]
MNIPSKFCVYTLLIGDYEALNEQPMALESDIPFICLTDNPLLTSESWTIVQVSTAFPMDPIRSQRILKTCPHWIPALSEFDRSLYIDNSVILREAPERFVGSLEAASGIGLPTHSFRNTVHDEFIEVARVGFDDQNRIFEQLNHYLATGDAALEERPHWTAILLRDHRNDKVRRAMESWMFHVLRYSRRDQLSFNTAMRSVGLVPDRWEIDNHDSFFHTWPHTPQRERFAGPRNPLTSFMPPQTQLAQLRHELESTQAKLQVAQVELDGSRQEANGFLDGITARARQLDQVQAMVDRQRTDAEHAAQRFATLQAATTDQMRALEEMLAAVHASTSWRVTGPLRRIKRWLRRV